MPERYLELVRKSDKQEACPKSSQEWGGRSWKKGPGAREQQSEVNYFVMLIYEMTAFGERRPIAFRAPKGVLLAGFSYRELPASAVIIITGTVRGHRLRRRVVPLPADGHDSAISANWSPFGNEWA
ncbi:FtsQ [Anopheles sinensis]|uniref:FtsQ n=1 Tax=Anopheles sinensis TaxID=74873 RepID=A0A084W8S1_ANOSI|nr:FtsQ [Anopheles sinensis]